uniref:Uncharacterized protein n=1 Tax=viral metagenome TaxID=1070528 RepID=A0A6C0KXE0_9ZZZZ
MRLFFEPKYWPKFFSWKKDIKSTDYEPLLLNKKKYTSRRKTTSDSPITNIKTYGVISDYFPEKENAKIYLVEGKYANARGLKKRRTKKHKKRNNKNTRTRNK